MIFGIRMIRGDGQLFYLGDGFYERVIELQNEFNINNIIIQNTIQINLTLLNEEFADFLAQNIFRIGSSFYGINGCNIDEVLVEYLIYQ